MKIHIYDYLNKNKKALIDGAEFLSIQVAHTIDDFSSCSLSFGITGTVVDTDVSGFDNIYVEDDNGNIIFGGIIQRYNVKPTGGTLYAIDHRWILTRLVLDEAVDLKATDDVLEVVGNLIDLAKVKRQIPIEFDSSNSAINTEYRADLRFEIGDDIGGCLQKIIQTIYARWQMRYYKKGNEIYGRLILRSVKGVTPEGVGISRSFAHSEDGSQETLYYGEGDSKSNIQDFDFNFDLTSYASRTKIGAKINNTSEFYDSLPPEASDSFYALEYVFGKTEGFMTDYNATSQATALALADINRVFPRQDFDIVLSPTYEKIINCGDRVNIIIDAPVLKIARNLITVRVDGVTYSTRDGILECRLFVNSMSPQKRTGTTGLLQAISGIKQRLDDLDKNYFNNS